jgi:hypothetical protein
MYTTIIEKMMDIQCKFRQIDSRLYLDYGDSFDGLYYYNHYSNLIEPIFMQCKKKINRQIYLNQSAKNGLNIYHNGSFIIINNLEYLIMNCDCVYAYNSSGFLCFLASSMPCILPHNFDKEFVYYKDGYCFKQVSIDEENNLVFQFQKYIKFASQGIDASMRVFS